MDVRSKKQEDQELKGLANFLNQIVKQEDK
jgi:hypothetical protein